MSYEFDNERPIYLQIVDIITKEITSGILKPGQKLPSVREYALLLKANPNTVCKALDILEHNKLIYTERTNGKFVTNDDSIIKNNKHKLFLLEVNNFINEVSKMGYSKEELLRVMEEKLK